MKQLLFILLFSIPVFVSAQERICINESIEHTITSSHLQEERTYWVSLPLRYSDTLSYPVIYVLDAEWRFDLLRNIIFELGAWEKIEQAIVVGIPHVDWEYKRGIDLTFSQSRVEYDGEPVDSTWYNDSNSGGGMNFYNYFTQELIPDVNQHYATNDHETLIGHSYGGYFGGYILSLDHPFEVIHIYDPSIWYSNGEVINRLQNSTLQKDVRIHLTYQPAPAFHKQKIEAFLDVLEANKNIQLTKTLYPDDTHNGLFLDSFYQGILKTH